MNAKLPRTLRLIALALCAATSVGSLHAVPAAAPAAAGLPPDSVYQLPVTLTDPQGQQQPWAAHRGRPMLVSMFYTSCDFVYPMIVESLHATRARLSVEERGHMPVMLVSIDPARDTVDVLRQTVERRQLDPAVWTLARTDAKSVRQLAAVLGIQYRALANGDFNHSTLLILLDADGRVMARTARLGVADADFVEKVRAAAQGVQR